MKRILIVIALMMALTGCYRNSPEDQVKDFKTCVDGGMRAYMTTWGEIQCQV